VDARPEDCASIVLLLPRARKPIRSRAVAPARNLGAGGFGEGLPSG
jgi:hypothetical protein